MHSILLVTATLLGAVNASTPMHAPALSTLVLIGLLLLGVLRTRP
ncbi:hypothetical protein [Rhizomicrobium electricum]|jgi:hypothetical protein|nr:hypothetical protein [Rhizomicrobium electricum]NIJ46842.1 hypothetical protein [Rhizomicrobium electricum]